MSLLRVGILLSFAHALFAPPLHAREDPLAAPIARANRSAASRLVRVGMKALEKKQAATARAVFERALRLDGSNAAARAKLGYRKVKGKWARSRAAEAELEHLADTSQPEVERLKRMARDVESWRAKEIVRICDRVGTPETSRPHLQELLKSTPRSPTVHLTLGHRRIGDRYVRPELEAFFLAMPGRFEDWAACRKPAGPVERSNLTLTVPGFFKNGPLFRYGDRHAGGSYTNKNCVFLAARMECGHKLMRHLFGERVNRWDPSPVYFLTKKHYKAFVYGRHTDEGERKYWMRHAGYRGKDCQAFRIGFSGALDIYTHSAGYYTAARLTAPPNADDPENGERQWGLYPWLKEGLGFFLTLELFDTADSSFASRKESTGKIDDSTPPKLKNRANCMAWVRSRLLAQSARSLRAILGTSLNNLDRADSLQAWTFLRFLALYDPAGFRKLPEALRNQLRGAQVERAATALKEVFGKDLEELERLWSIYVLELASS
ncbi:MAG: tetratricopeptide repeat protein [Planctomycetota bacterium]